MINYQKEASLMQRMLDAELLDDAQKPEAERLVSLCAIMCAVEEMHKEAVTNNMTSEQLRATIKERL